MMSTTTAVLQSSAGRRSGDDSDSEDGESKDLNRSCEAPGGKRLIDLVKSLLRYLGTSNSLCQHTADAAWKKLRLPDRFPLSQKTAAEIGSESGVYYVRMGGIHTYLLFRSVNEELVLLQSWAGKFPPSVRSIEPGDLGVLQDLANSLGTKEAWKAAAPLFSDVVPTFGLGFQPGADIFHVELADIKWPTPAEAEAKVAMRPHVASDGVSVDQCAASLRRAVTQQQPEQQLLRRGKIVSGDADMPNRPPPPPKRSNYLVRLFIGAILSGLVYRLGYRRVISWIAFFLGWVGSGYFLS